LDGELAFISFLKGADRYPTYGEVLRARQDNINNDKIAAITSTSDLEVLAVIKGFRIPAAMSIE
jgi:hypothetical protein